ncbi:MAG TPA: stress response translation initiation inhibitor YciH, partial [Euryarchaeota archaeon]|nr:stress response translation initiation inhibitor YciH [Euryarchaeota archaeon]HIQ10088.1 stress response translation initiation inhibitor YciH [Euryarchaeota archaeon]
MAKKDLADVIGLPEDLIEPESLTRELMRIKIRRDKRKWGKVMTIISGFDDTVDVKALAKKLKRQLGCGGTYDPKERTIELQGDHARKVREFLIKEGFPEENIDVV